MASPKHKKIRIKSPTEEEESDKNMNALTMALEHLVQSTHINTLELATYTSLFATMNPNAFVAKFGQSHPIRHRVRELRGEVKPNTLAPTIILHTFLVDGAQYAYTIRNQYGRNKFVVRNYDTNQEVAAYPFGFDKQCMITTDGTIIYVEARRVQIGVKSPIQFDQDIRNALLSDNQGRIILILDNGFSLINVQTATVERHMNFESQMVNVLMMDVSDDGRYLTFTANDVEGAAIIDLMGEDIGDVPSEVIDMAFGNLGKRLYVSTETGVVCYEPKGVQMMHSPLFDGWKATNIIRRGAFMIMVLVKQGDGDVILDQKIVLVQGKHIIHKRNKKGKRVPLEMHLPAQFNAEYIDVVDASFDGAYIAFVYEGNLHTYDMVEKMMKIETFGDKFDVHNLMFADHDYKFVCTIRSFVDDQMDIFQRTVAFDKMGGKMNY